MSWELMGPEAVSGPSPHLKRGQQPHMPNTFSTIPIVLKNDSHGGLYVTVQHNLHKAAGKVVVHDDFLCSTGVNEVTLENGKYVASA